MSNLISCVSWVKRGVATRHPRKYVLDEHELERVTALARIELEDARQELERAHKAAQKMGKGAEGDEADDPGDTADEWIDEEDDAMVVDGDKDEKKPSVASGAKTDDLAEYHLDAYDDDVDDQGTGPFTDIKGLTFYRDNTEDPYITLKEDDDDERQDVEILPTDNLLVTAKTEDEISQLEIYIYDEAQENVYAVGTLDPEIEIWSLDVIESMYPDMVLGRPDKTAAHVPVPAGTGKKKRKKTKARPTSDTHHVDAVLGLSWNRTHRHMLASASADRTVKLWDLSRAPTADADGSGESAAAIRSFNFHKDKVQAVQWNDKEPTVLLSGSYDRTVRVFDSRAPDTGVGAVLGADVEALRWDPWESHAFYVSLENGLVLNFDARTLPTDIKAASPSLFTISAHDGAASALDVSPLLRGCLVTGGTDKVVKVWNVDQSGGGKPSVSMVVSRDLDIGKVFSAVFSPDDPLTIAAAGSKAKLQIWDVGANPGARKTFASKLSEAGKVLKEKSGAGLVGLVSDDEEKDES
ncbi:transductin family protein/WD-40 repeat family protein [Boletus edulis]|nr:transductin family protein/WD-40 repeat family protein [Boletus edulis]